MIRKISLQVMAVLALLSLGCATSQIGVAPTIAGKYFQARVEYSQVLIAANEYKASPTANPEIVQAIQETDLRIQAVEVQIQHLLELGDENGVLTQMNLYVFIVRELRNQLITRGVLNVEDK